MLVGLCARDLASAVATTDRVTPAGACALLPACAVPTSARLATIGDWPRAVASADPVSARPVGSAVAPVLQACAVATIGTVTPPPLGKSAGVSVLR